MQILTYDEYAKQFQNIKNDNEMNYETKCRLCIDLYLFIKQRKLESDCYNQLISDLAEYITIFRKL